VWYRLGAAIFGRVCNIGDEHEAGGLDRLDQGWGKRLCGVSKDAAEQESALYLQVDESCRLSP
jgi:hypothetical protein